MTRHCCSKFMSSNPQTKFCRDAMNLNLILVSAANLPYHRRLSGGAMKVYAEVSLDGGAAKRSDVDREGETNPTWNFEVNFPVNESTRKTGGNLVVNLYCKRSLGHKFIGAVKIKVESLFEKWLDYENTATKPVEGTNDGKLSITYSFGICG